MSQPAGVFLCEEVAERGWDVAELSTRSGIAPQRIVRIFSSTEQITEDISRQLGNALGMSPGFWQRLDQQFWDDLHDDLERE